MKDESAEEYPLIAIVGPTAVGKSALGLTLAERLDGEVVNYDSVQIYRGFDIGTGKLPLAERRGIPHHLVDCLDPGDSFTAGDFRREALKVLHGICQRAKLPILVGGTGLYLRALLLGLFEGPPRSEQLRARLRGLADRRGRESIHRLLKRLDPASARRIDPQDLQKAIRAVEVCLMSRQSLSALHAGGRQALEGFRCLKIGLNPARDALYARINQRVEWMFASGLREEVQRLLAQPDAPRMKAMGALGYRQVAAALGGEITWQKALEETQAVTRQYAKRQMTWFRRESEVTWFSAFGDDPELQDRVLGSVSAMLGPKSQEGVNLPKTSSLF